MALGFLCSWRVAVWLCKYSGKDSDLLTSMITWLMLTAIIGARLAYVIEHWSTEFADNPLSIIRFDQGGLMFYGGFIAASVFTVIYIKIKKTNLFELSDVILTILPLGHAFGRIGCFMHGCCYGKITQSKIGVCFPKFSPAWWEQSSSNPPLIPETATQSLPVIPTQLIESAANLTLFIILFILFRKKYQNLGFMTGMYLISYAIIRFMIEFLRGDPRATVGPLSISQAISIGLIAVGIFAIAYSRRKRIIT